MDGCSSPFSWRTDIEGLGMRSDIVGRNRGLGGIPGSSQSEGYSSSVEEGRSSGDHSRRLGVGGVDGEDEEGVGEGDDSEDARRVSAGAAARVGETCFDEASKPPSRGVAFRLTLNFPLALDAARSAFRWDFWGREEGAYL
jgi:hypothetical protein